MVFLELYTNRTGKGLVWKFRRGGAVDSNYHETLRIHKHTQLKGLVLTDLGNQNHVHFACMRSCLFDFFIFEFLSNRGSPCGCFVLPLQSFLNVQVLHVWMEEDVKSSLLDLSVIARLAMRERRATSVSPGCTGCPWLSPIQRRFASLWPDGRVIKSPDAFDLCSFIRQQHGQTGTRKLLENEVRESLNNSSILRKVLVFGPGLGLWLG